MKKLFIYSIMAIISGNLIAGTRDSTTNQRATKYVKASNPVSATNNSSNIQTNNSTTKKSPSSGNWLVQKFNSDGSYYYQDPVTNEKWIPDSNGNLVIYNSTTETIIPALGVSLSKAKSACESLHVDNYYGVFDETTYNCKIPVVATNWSGEISKNGQVVMTYADMGTQFNCNKNSFEQVEALRRSSQWVMPLLMAGSTGIGYGIDYAVDKAKAKNANNSQIAEAMSYGANKQVSEDNNNLQANIDSILNSINITLDGQRYEKHTLKINFETGKSTITEVNENSLNNFVNEIKRTNNSNNTLIWIIGQASNINHSGQSDLNDKLAYDRAMATYNYLKNELPNVNFEIAFRGARMNISNDINNNNQDDRVSIISAYVQTENSNDLNNIKHQIREKLIQNNFSTVNFSEQEINKFSNNPANAKNFWTKEGLSGAVIGGAVGTVGAIGFWAAEGASIRCNISGLADIKLNKTYTIPSFKEYLRQYGWNSVQ